MSEFEKAQKAKSKEISNKITGSLYHRAGTMKDWAE
jgi:hypothetical protein